jgi:signal transduction histidine kinase
VANLVPTARVDHDAVVDLGDLATGLLLLTAAGLAARSSDRVTSVVWSLALAGVTWFAAEGRTGIPVVDSVLGSFAYMHLGFLAAAAVLASGWLRAPLWGGLLLAGSWPLAGRSAACWVGWEALAVVTAVGLVRASAGRVRTWAVCGLALAAAAQVVGRSVSAWATPTTASWVAPSAYEGLIGLSGMAIVMAVRASFAVGGEVADAVIRIAAGDSSVARQVLAEVLADSSVDVAVCAASGWADEQGRPRPAPVQCRGRVVIPVVVDGDVVALIGCSERAAQRPGVARAIDAAGALASENAAMRTSLAAHSRRLEEARRRLVVLDDEQRSALSRRLLSDTRGASGEIARRLEEAEAAVAGHPELAAAIRDARGQHRAVERELHQLAEGLAANLGAGLRRAVLETGAQLGLEVSADLPTDPPSQLRRTMYFVCMEALSNVVKHAGTKRARVRCLVSGDVLTLVVTDDGRGGASVAAGTGLQGIADRVSALGGTCTVRSPAGQGTTLTVTLPFPGTPPPVRPPSR